MTSSWRLAIIVFWTAIIVVPIAFGGAFVQRIAALTVLAAIAASAWNIVGGYAGQISFGHAMYYGIGAYSALLCYTKLGWPPIAGVPVGMLLSVCLSLLIGFPTFRLSGHYFSMGTIALATLLGLLFGNWGFVGASTGVMGPAAPRTVFDLVFRSAWPYYIIFLAVLAVVLLSTYALQERRMGFYLRALGASDRAAASLGVKVKYYKLYALLLSGVFTALAGSLYAIMVGFVDPPSVFGIIVSVNMVVMAALGGAGTLFGPVVGAVILVPVGQLANAYLGGGKSGAAYVIYGIVIMVLARFSPGGLLRALSRWPAKRRRHAA